MRKSIIKNKAGFTPLEIGRLTATVYGRLRQIVSCAFIELKYPDAMRKRASLTGFTLVEVLASVGILITFLTAALVSFTSTQNLSEGTQQQAQVLQQAKAKLEEMRAYNFRGLKSWYNQDGPPADGIYENRAFNVADGKGSILLSDVYNDNPNLTESYLGSHDDTPTAGDNWIQATPTANWSARDSHAAVVFDDGRGPKIWVLGGEGSSLLNDVWYSADGTNWTQATPTALWSARDCHAAAVVFDNGTGPKIWVLGGQGISGISLNDVWSSSNGITWTPKLSDNPAPGSNQWPQRKGHAAVVFDNKIWVLGGQDSSNSYLNDVWSSSDGITWTKELIDDSTPGSNQWEQRSRMEAVVFDNKIWVIGGLGSSNNYLNDVWSSSDGITWTQATLAAWAAGGRGSYGSAVLDGRIWVLGGQGSGSLLNEVWYSEDGINWTQASNFSSQRTGHVSVAYGNKFWVLGGWSSSGRKNDVWWAYGAERMYQADITISWRQRNGRIIGEDTDLDGVLDPGEDANSNGILDSPVHVSGILANRGYPSQIYMGRE